MVNSLLHLLHIFAGLSMWLYDVPGLIVGTVKNSENLNLDTTDEGHDDCCS